LYNAKVAKRIGGAVMALNRPMKCMLIVDTHKYCVLSSFQSTNSVSRYSRW